MRFEETECYRHDDGAYRLCAKADKRTLLELSALDLPGAVRAGFFDPEQPHHSLFQYAQMLAVFGEYNPSDSDTVERFLDSLKRTK